MFWLFLKLNDPPHLVNGEPGGSPVVGLAVMYLRRSVIDEWLQTEFVVLFLGSPWAGGLGTTVGNDDVYYPKGEGREDKDKGHPM